MKKNIFISIIALMTLSFIAIQCQKSEKVIEEQNNSKIIQKNSNLDNVLNSLKKNGISIVKEGNELELRNGLCYHNDPDSCYYIGELYDTVVVQNVCDKVAVSYNLYWCPENGELNFTDFRALPISPDCNDYLKYWYSLYYAAKYTELGLSMDSLEYAASKVAEENIAYAFALEYGFICPNDLLRSNFEIQICYKRCLRFKGSSKWPRFEITKIQCGSKCCKRTRKFCILPEGGTYSSGEDYEELFGTCGGWVNPIECDGGYIFGECDRECGPPPTK